jgi:hypothetical protein
MQDQNRRGIDNEVELAASEGHFIIAEPETRMNPGRSLAACRVLEFSL